jgi:hypothetical protein
MSDLTVKDTVVNRIVPKNMADAMVVSGAVSDATDDIWLDKN